jgi:hypothetical protein
MICVMSLMAVISLAVDFGRVQLVKTELARAADAAARSAAAQMGTSLSDAITSAKNIASANPVDSGTLALLNEDIQFGVWNTGTRVFTHVVTNNPAEVNAVRITAKRVHSRGTAVPLMFARTIGMETIDVTHESIVTTTGQSATGQATVTGKANVWFGGLPSSATAARSGDVTYASTCPAIEFTAFQISGGGEIAFNATGTLSNTGGGGNAPDGNTGSIQRNETNNLGGKSNIRAPLNSLIGVFLSDDDPAQTAAPSELDFSSSASRNYTTLSPQLKQTFYIGDGQANGQQQTIAVPAGATRLYMGSMDPYGWHNNSGVTTVTITRIGGTITLVR